MSYDQLRAPTSDQVADEQNRGFLQATNEVVAAPVEHPPELRNELVTMHLPVLASYLSAIVVARQWALAELEKDTEQDPLPITHELPPIVTACATIAMGTATTLIGESVAAAILGAIALESAAEVATTVLEDAVTGALDARLESAMATEMSHPGADGRIPFFRSTKDILGSAVPKIQQDLLNASRIDALMQLEDPVDAVSRMIEAGAAQEPVAKEHQRNQSLGQWLALLAQAELGTVEEPGNGQAGTDLSNDTNVEAGVLRIDVVGAADLGVDVNSAQIAGIGEGAIESVKAATPMDLRTPTMVTAHVEGPPSGIVEFGINEVGSLFLWPGTGMAYPWLARYGGATDAELEQAPTDAALEPLALAGADLLVQELMTRTFSELCVQRD